MNQKKKKIVYTSLTILALVAYIIMLIFAANATTRIDTFWALIPPVVAIILALITKEVYSSLFVGIVTGALFYSNFSFEGTANHILQGGFISVLSNKYNVGILIFLVILGVIVALMNKAGGSAAFGRWASTKIKSRIGAQIATIALGILIFVDDYFNCLTVGSVMRPVTDKHNVSRSKLAYLIDSTAAPICIIAPISSWAAAVSGFVDGEDGFSLFVSAIPYNFYALLTILMMFLLVLFKVDFGLMSKHEENAKNGDLFSNKNSINVVPKEAAGNSNGKVIDLILPVFILIICCIVCMLYTGGFFSGETFITAFSNCDASLALSMGGILSLLFTIVIYLLRRVLSFKEIMSCLPEGFKAMVPAILILTFAWTLKAMTDSLGAANFVKMATRSFAGSFMSLLPAIIFIIACLLAFATGTSWGTFGILIPIVVEVFENTDPTLMIISISACMAGAVCGDHCSPISDTTIMASAGAQCDHVNHVSTQLPYAILVATISFITYIVAGFSKSVWISLPFGICLTIVTLLGIKYLTKQKQNA